MSLVQDGMVIAKNPNASSHRLQIPFGGLTVNPVEMLGKHLSPVLFEP